MSHLLVTNDFPPKLGGIQSYLWELWRRLDPETFTVLTTP
jgi:phosphatidylinositol alpha-1,6-mannosyltransferase